MPTIDDILSSMKSNPKDVMFSDLTRVCEYFFGKPRIKGSHHFFSVPWQREPLVNIQGEKGKAKVYQVKQILRAVEVLKGMDDV